MVAMTAGTLATRSRGLYSSTDCTRPAERCSLLAIRSTNPATARPRSQRWRTLVWAPSAVVGIVIAAVAVAVVVVHRIRRVSLTNGICSRAMTVVASFDHGCGI